MGEISPAFVDLLNELQIIVAFAAATVRRRLRLYFLLSAPHAQLVSFPTNSYGQFGNLLPWKQKKQPPDNHSLHRRLSFFAAR
jgi:hypothetical protein